MTAQQSGGLHMGPLQTTVEVVAFVAFTGMAWFNAVELLLTIFLSFNRWWGRYFTCLVVASAGVLVYQVFVFLQTFDPSLNTYAVTAAIDVGWSCMVTGQSLVLWSRLHLVSRNTWMLRAILSMIVFNAICLHIPQTGFSLAAIDAKTNTLNPLYKPFDIMEKISISVFTAQELIISSVYLWETVRILRVGEMVRKKSNIRRIQLLFLANIAIISVDIITISLEMSSLWGVWCSFKGFGYSMKLKIEFAILTQLRESVKSSTEGSSSHGGGFRSAKSDKDISLSSRPHAWHRKSAKPSGLALERRTFDQIEDEERITKTTEISIKHDEITKADAVAHPQEYPLSEASSEVGFATKGK
ncbi:hypothetical protein BU16DRAFT_95743 [Lophium mytilinum]|uniref:DUF7703 domain-containing protein n=1 Tax=Lophium mytilinum TaxID=390894 RepID=A0A6A6QQ76_9PEZI|nr:hypothetical protein BU16DRAFT_95743 [Lophium mytilinum]